jgi:signal transduction histidine kinase
MSAPLPSSTPAKALLPPSTRLRRFGLRGRMLALMALFVMATELAVFAPSLAEFRTGWLADRISDARAAAVALERAPKDEGLATILLDTIEARTVSLSQQGRLTLLAARPNLAPPVGTVRYDPRRDPIWTSITEAVGVFFAPQGRVVRVRDVAGGAAGRDIVAEFDEAPLRQAMFQHATQVLAAAAALALAVAGLAMYAVEAMVLRPIRRLTTSLVDFARDPEDKTRIIAPSNASHEIGVAERALEAMQKALAAELHERKRLAQLGLAVAKINHDLRNMLASAQLVTDRLASLDDPVARRLAPTLISTLDRAIAFCRSTLAYGRAVEPAPRIQPVDPRRIAQETAAAVAPMAPGLETVIEAPDGFLVHADPEQLYRIFLNLMRNAAEALGAAGAGGQAPRIVVRVFRLNVGRDAIDISDNGPGVPLMARARLFEPFGATGGSGGSGLGLAIAAELAQAHGGALELIDAPTGATFRLTLPSPASAA